MFPQEVLCLLGSFWSVHCIRDLALLNTSTDNHEGYPKFTSWQKKKKTMKKIQAKAKQLETKAQAKPTRDICGLTKRLNRRTKKNTVNKKISKQLLNI